MALTDQQKLDILWKLLQGRGQTSISRAEFEEAFKGISHQVPGTDVWTDPIPGTPPGGTTSVVEVHTDLKLTADATVEDNLVHLACSTYNDLGTRIGRFIDGRFGKGYVIKIFSDDGAGNKGARIYSGTVPYTFLYATGILSFESDPVAAGVTLPIHVEAKRYVGQQGPPASTEDLSFSFNQAVASATWTIDHNKGKKMVPIVVDGSGNIIHPDTITWPTLNRVVLTFATALAGDAHLN